MAEGSIAAEAPPDIVVNPIDREQFGTGTITRLFKEGSFLITHLDPQIHSHRYGGKGALGHVGNILAIAFVPNPLQVIRLEANLELAAETIQVDWEATAKQSGINPTNDNLPNLETLTLHSIAIPETGETITVHFDKKGPDLELSVQEGTKADKLQVVRAVQEHLRKVRAYYNQERSNQND